MKNAFLALAALLVFSVSAQAQMTIPNGSFGDAVYHASDLAPQFHDALYRAGDAQSGSQLIAATMPFTITDLKSRDLPSNSPLIAVTAPMRCYVSTAIANGVSLTCEPLENAEMYSEALPTFNTRAAEVAANLEGASRASLTATVTQTGTGHSVNLTWTQGAVPAGATCPSGSGSTAVTSNSVYRATTAGAEAKPALSVSSAPLTAYSDTAVTAGTTYFYKITATNCTSESAMSSELTVTIPNPLAPSAPTNFTGSAQ